MGGEVEVILFITSKTTKKNLSQTLRGKLSALKQTCYENCNDQAYSRPRGSLGIMGPLKSLQHHSNLVSRCLRWPLNWDSSIPRGVSPSVSRCNYFPVWMRKCYKSRKVCQHRTISRQMSCLNLFLLLFIFCLV